MTKQKQKKLLTMYTAGWCQACKSIKPRIEKLAKKYGFELIIFDVDKEIDQTINVKSLPAFYIEVGGFSHMVFNSRDLEEILKDSEEIKNGINWKDFNN